MTNISWNGGSSYISHACSNPTELPILHRLSVPERFHYKIDVPTYKFFVGMHERVTWICSSAGQRIVPVYALPKHYSCGRAIMYNVHYWQ